MVSDSYAVSDSAAESFICYLLNLSHASEGHEDVQELTTAIQPYGIGQLFDRQSSCVVRQCRVSK